MNIDKIRYDKRMPKHIGLIIDGNGRWAQKRSLSRSDGHKFGFENLKKHIQYIQELGIKNLSVYCFSKQNWNRPQAEVDYLMSVFDMMLDDYEMEFNKKDIRVIISGDMEDAKVPLTTRNKAKNIMALTKNNGGFILNLCVNYGGREEILKAVQEIIESGEKQITEAKFEQHLYTAELLPVDFIIRTSGEQRTSNFLPWQSTYSEWYFPKKHWPAFTKRELIKALKIYMKRNRRFGAIKGQK